MEIKKFLLDTIFVSVRNLLSEESSKRALLFSLGENDEFNNIQEHFYMLFIKSENGSLSVFYKQRLNRTGDISGIYSMTHLNTTTDYPDGSLVCELLEKLIEKFDFNDFSWVHFAYEISIRFSNLEWETLVGLGEDEFILEKNYKEEVYELIHLNL